MAESRWQAFWHQERIIEAFDSAENISEALDELQKVEYAYVEFRPLFHCGGIACKSRLEVLPRA
jgi:hypothetical protein